MILSFVLAEVLEHAEHTRTHNLEMMKVLFRWDGSEDT